MEKKYNHHMMAKTTSDEALKKWRQADWDNSIISNSVRSVSSSSSFPSPDASFYDSTNERLISFEFKPPTETKRGMLTSLGQALAYNNTSNLSYIFCPETVDGFNIQDYFQDLFTKHINGKLPIGLIGYKNDSPSDLDLLVDVEPKTVIDKPVIEKNIVDRYWAKHQDMPTQILFNLLNTAYLLPDMPNRKHEVWRETWLKYILLDGKTCSTLETLTPHIHHHYGTPYKQLSKTKSVLRKDVESGKISNEEALGILKTMQDPDKTGDSYANSYKKNFMTFVKHLGLWDDNSKLTETGYDLHKLGKIYGPNSEIFIDRLKFYMLYDGKHLDLITDFYHFSMSNRETTLKCLTGKFIEYYSHLGKIKWNIKKRKKDSQNEQFRYELIFWRKYGLISMKNSSDGYLSGGPIDFDWREITRICSLV
jgi:hypothetical protein